MVRALVVEEVGRTLLKDVDDAFLGDADVHIDVAYSGINYKDGLAITGRGKVVRSYPLIPGIDLVGTVRSSRSGTVTPGTTVILNGQGIGEEFHGGLAEQARVRSEGLVVLPSSLDPVHAAAIGTAGFTAMLGVLALEDYGITASSGPILVTGAAGGVGSVAISLLAARGFEVVASTGRPQESDYLRSLGASEVIDRAQFQELGRPLQSQRWAGAIDSAGSATLANVLAQTQYGGAVVSCGLAQGADLPVTVMPFILRGVALLGANSVYAPQTLRERAWARLASDIDRSRLESVSTTVNLEDALGVAERILEGSVRGRTVVDVRA